MWYFFLFDYILDAHKISNNILIYLLITGYCNWRPPPPIIKIVKYCDVRGGGEGHWVRQNLAKK